MPTPKQALSGLIAHIENNLEGPLSLELLEQASGLSRFALTRLFARVVGLTPMDYVRGRRLARSLPQLLRGDTVLDVALLWGFEYEQSYIRAFKSAYGMTPARFRRGLATVPITEVPRLEGFTVSSGGMLGRPEIIVQPAFSLSGEVRGCHYADNLLWGKPLAAGVRNLRSGCYTAAYRQAGTFWHRHMACGGAPEETWRYPAGRWARFRYVGLHALDAEGARRVRLMAQLVVGSWQRENGLPPDVAFIERVESGNLGEAYCEVEMLFPMDVF